MSSATSRPLSTIAMRSLSEVGAASVRFDYHLRAADGRLYAEGSTRLACIDAQLTLQRISPEMVHVLCQPERA